MAKIIIILAVIAALGFLVKRLLCKPQGSCGHGCGCGHVKGPGEDKQR